ncbi:phosphohydrolase [Alcaligenes faecalis]|uniref:HD domain-containing protein n=1 Tax=Alcaligenes faecalis TaxID=511 RepID=UPI00193380B3|nr:HD domain-containing protein [Alcaligenes faecalis]QRF91012.1 phosphohydrolase [Alcaligenes faecalis]
MLKMIKDPIHDFVEFRGEYENDLLSKVVSDPFFQRLRRIKQLGFSDYVFPSATHSRFSHSLGVYSVAKMMLSVKEPGAVEAGRWSKEGKQCLAAALLHDVGHGMFSHSFEKAMEFFFARNPEYQKKFPNLKAAVNHEKISERIIKESSMHEVLEGIGGNGFSHGVSDLIEKKNKNCIYTSIVSGQLDADRLDYAKRDSYFAGIASGGIDLGWLIRNLKVNSGQEGEFFYADSKAYVSLEQFAVTLFQLYPNIYFHKKTRGLEYMFSLLMCHVFELIAQGDLDSLGLAIDHPFVVFFKDPSDINNSLFLDDATFLGSLYLFINSKNSFISTLARRILERRIYPLIDVWEIAEGLAGYNKKFYDLDAQKRLIIINNLCNGVRQEIANTEDWNESNYYDFYSRPIYKKINNTGGHPQQINVKIGSDFFDISSVSPIIGSEASFSIHRIYYDDSIEGYGEKLREIIEGLMSGKLTDYLNTISSS